MVVLKELFFFFTVSIFGGCDGIERTDFQQFLLWDVVVVLKELSFNSFYVGGCDGLEGTDFLEFLLWEGWWS